MRNIDESFVADIFGTEIVPGLAQYREQHHTGDVIFDFILGYQVTKIIKASFIVKNAFNREYMDRPGNIQPPRSFTVQLAATI